MIVPVILSGGSGSRLWPLSRPQQPKQLLAMVDERTMLRATFDRLTGLPDVADPLIVCNASHHHLVAAELAAARRDATRILLEPLGRNTAPAAAAAALYVLEHADDPLLLVLPADHVIRDEATFRAAVAEGVDHADAGRLVTFGIVPAYAETGYGYIRAGESIAGSVRKVDAFVEKPDHATAESYVADGNHLWNSGMFLFRASRYLEELEQTAPDIVNAVRGALAAADRSDGIRLDRDEFEKSPSDSIDFAVMEHTKDAVVVPLDAGWSDVGSWSALSDIALSDDAGNVVVGDVATLDVTSSYLRSESRLVAAVGLEDMIVVETADAVLVAPKNRAQDVKAIVAELLTANRSEAQRHLRELRPWGAFELVDAGPRFRVSRLTVLPSGKLSTRRDEHPSGWWIVVRGTGLVTVGAETVAASAGDGFAIPAGSDHVIENSGSEPLEIIEVRFAVDDEDDDQREHDHGRS